MMKQSLLTINPGSTSTKIAYFSGTEQLISETLRYTSDQLAGFDMITDQLQLRLPSIEEFITRNAIDLSTLSAVVGRGGLLKPLASGTYIVNELMIEDLRQGKQGHHASNLGGILASALASPLGIPAYIVDPVSVDEFEDVARVSGLPELPRRSLLHALNVRAVAHRVSAELAKPLEELNLVIVHLGGGISVAPMRRGRLIDVNNANENGPFSPERTGTLPVVSLIKLCFSGQYSEKELIKKVNGHGGLMAHLGTTDLIKIEERIAQGDQQAKLVFAAMAYQVAKEIGAMATVLEGRVDYIVLTGGMAHSKSLTDAIVSKTQWIASALLHPGEDELQALAEGAWRVITGQESPMIYS